MDEEIVYRNCKQAQEEKRDIDDATARVIAAWYTHDRYPAIEAFVSTGAIICDPEQLSDDLSWRGALYDKGSTEHQTALDMLVSYLMNREDTGPVNGWSDLWVR